MIVRRRRMVIIRITPTKKISNSAVWGFGSFISRRERMIKFVRVDLQYIVLTFVKLLHYRHGLFVLFDLGGGGGVVLLACVLVCLLASLRMLMMQTLDHNRIQHVIYVNQRALTCIFKGEDASVPTCACVSPPPSPLPHPPPPKNAAWALSIPCCA